MKTLFLLFVFMVISGCSKEPSCDIDAVKLQWQKALSDPQLSERQYDLYYEAMLKDIEECKEENS